MLFQNDEFLNKFLVVDQVLSRKYGQILAVIILGDGKYFEGFS
jgi:hypothetical protein